MSNSITITKTIGNDTGGDVGSNIINVCGASKSYGELTVLNECDMTVRAGEHVALIGPSGSGKTTILRMLVGLECPDSGTVEIDGHSLWHMSRGGKDVVASEKHLRAIRRSVGMVFQHFNLFPHLTALENVTLAPRHVLGMGKTEADARAIELLERVGLGDKTRHTPNKLSGGQQQRVAIARALALQPKIMLFDEVTSALDPELVNEVLKVIRDLARESEMTLVMVTHEIEFVAEVADRMLMFDQGKIIESGPPKQMLKAPQQARTQKFLQSILDRRGV